MLLPSVEEEFTSIVNKHSWYIFIILLIWLILTNYKYLINPPKQRQICPLKPHNYI